MARALGWHFLDRHGCRVERWIQLDRLHSVAPPSDLDRLPEVRAAVDVQNPLLGPRGCTRIYGPQKGIRPREFTRAERCLRRLADVLREHFGRDQQRQAGAGAAGGLGFGLRCFLGAELVPGFQVFAQCARLEQRLRQADLVVTGEGALDRSTLMGKGVGELARLSRRLGIPCIGLGGQLDLSRLEMELFSELNGLTTLTTVEEALARPALWLTRLAARVADQWSARGDS
jgi:glycerate kinase